MGYAGYRFTTKAKLAEDIKDAVKKRKCKNLCGRTRHLGRNYLTCCPACGITDTGYKWWRESGHTDDCRDRLRGYKMISVPVDNATSQGGIFRRLGDAIAARLGF